MSKTTRGRPYLVTVSSGFSRSYAYIVKATSRRQAIRTTKNTTQLEGDPWRYRARKARDHDKGHHITTHELHETPPRKPGEHHDQI